MKAAQGRDSSRLRARLLAALVLLAGAGAAAAQEPPVPAPDATPPSRFQENVEVIGVTPIHGIGLPRQKVPANVQIFSPRSASTGQAIDVPELLAGRAASVQTSDAHGGTFQPDLLFRGFSASPLLGASEGLAVYQDGVRVNEPFGDTMNWDALPSSAIASINLIPGSNPLFGLNALGGALSIRTRNGFEHSGRRVSLTTGAFARHTVEAETGGHGATVAYYLTGAVTRDGGWRDFSRSTTRRLFGDLAWRGLRSSVSISVTAAANDLAGNGSAPVDLLASRPSAVFTYPDLTSNDVVLGTMRATRQISDRLLVESVGYVRHSGIHTFNGDEADDDDGESDDAGEDEGVPGFDALANVSDTQATGAGGTVQLTSTAVRGGRENQLIVGGSVDAAFTRFQFSSEWATLTPSRGTHGSGLVDADSLVHLETTTATAGAFVSNTWSATGRLALSVAARVNGTSLRLHDRIGTALEGTHAFWRINPAAGVTFDLAPRLNAYAGYTESSRVPTPVELTCADPTDPCRLPNAFVSDPPLDQIVGRTLEGGVRRLGGPFTWAVALFTTRVHDDIVFISSGTLRGEGHFENIDRTLRHGLETTVDVTKGPVSLFAAYTLQRATFGTDLRIASRHHPDAANGEIAVVNGDRLPGVPTHSGKAGVSAAIGDRLAVSVTARAQSGQHFRGDEANLLPPVPGFAVVDARARVRIASRFAVIGEAENVFDARYATFGALGDASLVGSGDPRFHGPGAPRGGWVGLELTF